MGGRIGRGHQCRRWFALELGRAQGPGYCHQVQGFLSGCANAVSTVVDVVGGFLDRWLVVAGDNDGCSADGV